MKKHHPMLNILSDNFITVRPDNDVKEAMNIVILDSKDETIDRKSVV